MTESQKKQAKISSLRLLAATPKSRNELAKKLSEKGFDGRVIRETLDELEKQGLLNDRAYAQEIVVKNTQGHLSGAKKIAFDLKRHGISEEVRVEMLSNLTPEQEAGRAREAALQRWERFKNLPEEKRRKRVYDFLVRRGFDYQIAREVVEELASETEPSS